MSQVQVVAAIIRRESRFLSEFLLGKRALHKKSAPGFWSPISGKIESGESEADAVVRECFEEVGLTVQALRKITQHDMDGGRARLHWWLVDVLEGREFLKNDEHTELRWFSLDEIKHEKHLLEDDREALIHFDATLD
jgi:8-oxo-dGTP diphosphatase